MTREAIQPATLVQHASFVRALALDLVGDAHRAADVAQETMVRAIQSPPRDAGALRAWLARVAQRLAWGTRREEARRAKRERAVARSEAPAPDGGRERVLAEVSRAVLELAEPYRSAVLQRYYENRSAREIAAAEGISVHSVHSRLRRAQEQLRVRLDRRIPGGRIAWTVGLLALTAGRARAMGRVASGSLKQEILALSSQTKLVTAFGVLVLAVLAILTGYAGFGRDGSPDDQASPAVAVVTAPVPSQSEAADRREPVDTDAVAAADSPAKPATGSLVLRVTWARDGTPAADRWFQIFPFDDPEPFRSSRTVRTDRFGEARVENLPPGRNNLYGDVGGGGRAEVVAGETVIEAITIPIGIDVRGRVVDPQGAPVAGASIWLSDYGNDSDGHVVTHANALGEFVVPSVGDGRRICAFAERAAPSKLIAVEGEPGRTITPTLVVGAEAATLSGRIVDAGGKPIGGVDLRLEFPSAVDQLGDRELAPRVAPVGDDGTFTISGLPAGSTALLVRPRPEFAPRRIDTDLVSGESRSVTVVLERSARVTGTVVDESQQPIAGAEIRYGAYAGFLSTLTRSGQAGSYVLDALPLGTVALTVEKDGVGKAEATLRLVAGVDVEWNPILTAGRVYRARIVDEHGEPRARWSIYAVANVLEHDGRTLWSRSAKTDASGRFSLTGCPDAVLKLEIRAPVYTPVAIAHHRGHPTGVEETIEIAAIALPSARVHGLVALPGGEPAARTEVLVHREGRGHPYRSFVAELTGEFEIDRMIPGAYVVKLSIPGLPALRVSELTLSAAGDRDLGTFVLPESQQLRIRVGGRDGIHEPVDEVWITPVAGGDRSVLPQRFAAGRVEPIPMYPGRYDVTATGSAMVRQHHVVEIVADQPAAVDITPQPGSPCRFTLATGERPATPRFMSFTVRRTDGTAVTSWSSYQPQTGAWTTAQRIPAGAFELTVRDTSPGIPRDADGRTPIVATMDLTVPAGGGAWTLELR